MKYSNPTVLEPDKVQIGTSYLLAELPAGIRFLLGSGTFRTVVQPKFNVVSRNCLAAPAEVWSEKRSASHRVAYRKRVKVLGRV